MQNHPLYIFRKSRGIRQTELSRRLKVSRQCLYNYESGKRRMPLSIGLRLIEIFHAHDFKVSLDELCPPKTKF